MLTLNRQFGNRKVNRCCYRRLVMPESSSTMENQSLDPALPEGANLARLWTPWRSEYVGVTQPPGCFLCAIESALAQDDKANLVLHREADVFMLLNRYPYNPAHLLIAPRAHVADFPALAADLRNDLFALVQRGTAVLRDVYSPSGLNIGLNLGQIAGAGLPDHLHVHVVPRWAADSNFMTVIGETRVLPESLDQTWEKLRPYFD
jgi:ATP adenylyltransferase